MKAAARFTSLFRDSPTYGLDRSNLISGFTIGIAALLLNGAVLMALLPFVFDPDDRDFRAVTEIVEVGQLLALILLGGATALATVLIPLRLLTVFWGPRMGRYFDQIVLSGISPLRFVIGKATSQNLFLGLILFLLLPHLVLSLTLGGVDLGFFVASLFLVWLYCMALALVTLWAALYMNELLAAILVGGSAGFLTILGCIPMQFPLFVMTPTPVLVHPLWSSIPGFTGWAPEGFWRLFAACAGCMSGVICVSLVAIYLGPLFGIIRENSTFGEVVRAGDNKRKRWFRLRLHIQRPSEIAFFYENRSDVFRGNEGLIRWGAGFCLLLVLFGGWYLIYLYGMSLWLAAGGGTAVSRSWIYELHTIYLSIHGCGLALAAFLFSHARNSTYLQIPFLFGRQAEVSRLDTRAFLLFMLVSTIASIAFPFQFERLFALPSGNTVFPDLMFATDGRPVDYVRVAIEGSLAISCAGLVIYALHRYVCLTAWLKSASILIVGMVYFMSVCLMPLFCGVSFIEVPELRGIPLFADWAPSFAMLSPFTQMMFLFNEMGSRFPRDVSTAPFYVGHAVILGVTMLAIRRRGRRVREMYLEAPTQKAD